MNSFNDNDRSRKEEDSESLESILNRFLQGEDFEYGASNPKEQTASSRFDKNPPQGFHKESGQDADAVGRRIGLCTLEKKEHPRDDLKNSHEKNKPIPKPGGAMLFFGVILPTLAMLFESQTHVMARSFLDPFPTLNHYLLFSIIPVSCFLTWLAARTNIISVYAITALGAGMALGVSILYTLMILPMTPLLFLMFPLGLLGLAPLFSIFQTLKAGNTICAIASRHDTFFDPHQFKHLGHLIILVMVVAVELPSTLTRIHLADASKADKIKAQQSLDWLRAWGSRDVLLRACYERSGRATDLIGSIYEHQHPVSVNTARNVYYKVTGVPFNATPIPSSFRGTIQHNGLIKDPARLNAGAVDEFDLDPDIAGEMVQGVARGLSVTDSKIEGVVDADACAASLNWTFNFANISQVPREARAKILLPPNAVVTRATMWIDGIEKEAKIMGRSRARATYVRAVTTHKRDPLLVSMQGKDTVLVQCYPVLKGSDTRVRLHIAVPLENKNNKAVLSLPMFAERNFTFTRAHKLSIESKTDIIDNDKTGKKLDKDLDNDLLARAQANLSFKRDSNKSYVEFKKPVLSSLFAPIETSFKLDRPEKLTIVVDKSKAMEPYLGAIKDSLKDLPKGLDVYLIEVGDSGFKMITRNIGEPQQSAELYLVSAPEVSTIKIQEAINLLDRTSCDGGRVNSNTIATLLLNNSESEGKAYGDILWIHGAQPITGARDKELVERLSKFMPAKLYDLQIASGPNALFDKSSMVKNFIRVPRSGDLKVDLLNLFSGWQKTEKTDSAEATENNTVKSSMPELESLKIYKEVLDKYYSGDIYGASALAVANHMITPVTSAVVTDDNIIEKYERRRKAKVAPESLPDQSRLSEIAMTLPLMILSPYGCGQRQASLDYERADQTSGASRNPIDRAFDKVTSKLNNLSDASGSAGYAPVQSGAPARDAYKGDLEAKMAPEGNFNASEKQEFSALQKKSMMKARRSSAIYPSTPKPNLAPEEEMGDESSAAAAGRANKESIPIGKALMINADRLKNDADDAPKDSRIVAQALELDGGELELITEGETKSAVNTKAEVVPEPETIFMLLLAMMVLVAGLFVIQKQRSLTEPK